MQNDFFTAVTAAAWQVKARIFNVKRCDQQQLQNGSKMGGGELQASRRSCGHASMSFSAIELNYVKN